MASLSADSWSAGFSEGVITPKLGQAALAGFGRERLPGKAIAPLRLQVLALRDPDGQAAVLICADVLGFDRTTVAAIRFDLQRRYGLGPGSVLLSASHTHWGPAINMRANFSIGSPNAWYVRFLEEQILANVELAWRNFGAAKIDYGAIDFRGIGCNRRVPGPGRRIGWGPYAEGHFDAHTPVLLVQRRKSPRRVVLVGHACHPTSSGLTDRYMPDYPGAMRARIEREWPDARGMFVMGCGADAKVVHRDRAVGKLVFSASPARSRAAGNKLGAAVLRHLREGQPMRVAGRLRTSLATGNLTFGQGPSTATVESMAIDREAYRWGEQWWARQMLAYPDARRRFHYEIQAWRLGEALTLVAMEGEVCSPWGPTIRAMAKTPQAMVVGYANSTCCYIPDRRIVEEGGYEGDSSHRAYLLPAPFTPKVEAEVKRVAAKALAGLD